MMRFLIISFCLLAGFNLQAEDKEIYIVVSATFTPKNDISYNDVTINRGKREMGIAYVACYPIKYEESLYSEELVKKTFNEYIQDKDKGTVMHKVEVSSFTDRKEAKDFYDDLTKSKTRKQAKRIPFTKSHLDRAQRKLVVEMREKEKENENNNNDNNPPEKPVLVTPPAVAKPMVNRALDDIYD